MSSRGQVRAIAALVCVGGLFAGLTGEGRAAPAAAECADGGWRDSFRQDGKRFGSRQACESYAARNSVVGLAVTVSDAGSEPAGAFFDTSESGFGLKPGSSVFNCELSSDGTSSCVEKTADSDGDHSATNVWHFDYYGVGVWGDPGTLFCYHYNHDGGSYPVGVYLKGTTASGEPVRSRTAGEQQLSGCDG